MDSNEDYKFKRTAQRQTNTSVAQIPAKISLFQRLFFFLCWEHSIQHQTFVNIKFNLMHPGDDEYGIAEFQYLL